MLDFGFQSLGYEIVKGVYSSRLFRVFGLFGCLGFHGVGCSVCRVFRFVFERGLPFYVVQGFGSLRVLRFLQVFTQCEFFGGVDGF